jgi:molybdopterin-guanine dinucleotide biosynthesis protein A
VIETFLGNGLVIRWIEQGDGAFIDNDLVNINTPEDLRQFRLSPP